MSAYDCELRDWFESLVDGTIDEPAHRALADRLDADAAARRAFVDHVELHAALNWEHAEPLAEPADDAAAGRGVIGRIEPTRRRTGRITWAIAAAVCMAGAAAAIVVATLTPAAAPQQPQLPPVAVLMAESGVRWTSEPQAVGEGVPPQTLAIESGVLEMQFNSGAAMAMRGPGVLTLVDAMRCRLDHGTITVHAPHAAAGFTVESATFDTVDIGTGFGVRRGVDGVGELHVFDGVVELRPAVGGMRMLKAGQAAAVDAAGAVRDVPIDVFAFPARADDPAPRWADFADRLTLDPSLAMHVKATATATADGDAATVSDRSTRHTAVRLLGGKPVDGRFGEADAVRLGQTADAIAFDLPGVHRAITMAMWVKLDRLPTGIASLIQTDGYTTGNPHWNLDATGTLTLGINGGSLVQAIEAIDAARLDRWTHLAVTYDADANRVAMYVEGRVVVDAAIDKPMPVGFGPSRIGNWDREPRPLGGDVADAMVFGRALDAKEIMQLFDAGAP